MGDKVRVKVISIDDQDRVKLSRKVLLREENPEAADAEAAANPRPPMGEGGGERRDFDRGPRPRRRPRRRRRPGPRPRPRPAARSDAIRLAATTEALTEEAPAAHDGRSAKPPSLR